MSAVGGSSGCKCCCDCSSLSNLFSSCSIASCSIANTPARAAAVVYAADGAGRDDDAPPQPTAFVQQNATALTVTGSASVSPLAPSSHLAASALQSALQQQMYRGDVPVASALNSPHGSGRGASGGAALTGLALSPAVHPASNFAASAHTASALAAHATGSHPSASEHSSSGMRTPLATRRASRNQVPGMELGEQRQDAMKMLVDNYQRVSAELAQLKSQIAPPPPTAALTAVDSAMTTASILRLLPAPVFALVYQYAVEEPYGDVSQLWECLIKKEIDISSCGEVIYWFLKRTSFFVKTLHVVDAVQDWMFQQICEELVHLESFEVNAARLLDADIARLGRLSSLKRVVLNNAVAVTVDKTVAVFVRLYDLGTIGLTGAFHFVQPENKTHLKGGVMKGLQQLFLKPNFIVFHADNFRWAKPVGPGGGAHPMGVQFDDGESSVTQSQSTFSLVPQPALPRPLHSHGRHLSMGASGGPLLQITAATDAFSRGGSREPSVVVSKNYPDRPVAATAASAAAAGHAESPSQRLHRQSSKSTPPLGAVADRDSSEDGTPPLNTDNKSDG